MSYFEDSLEWFGEEREIKCLFFVLFFFLVCHLTLDFEHMLFSYGDFLCLFNVDRNPCLIIVDQPIV